MAASNQANLPSRQELLIWVNGLLELNPPIAKVEQCGTGAVYCQLFDSIYRNVPMSKVKFKVNTEYAYIQNFTVLKNVFIKNNIDKIIKIEQLIKCRMQDNLEFLQWVRIFWDSHFNGDIPYNPVARRGGGSGGAMPSTYSGPSSRSGNFAPNSAARRAPAARARTPQSGTAANALRQENDALNEAIAGLEKERDFYFNKLRQIEVLVQQHFEEHPDLEGDEDHVLKKIQDQLYSTEDGFEIPEGEGVEEPTEDENETF